MSQIKVFLNKVKRLLITVKSVKHDDHLCHHISTNYLHRSDCKALLSYSSPSGYHRPTPARPVTNAFDWLTQANA